VRCARWHHGNVALLGDAAHTAHFSVGSGTKLAMEDAIALAAAVAERGEHDVEAALVAYEQARQVEVLKLQKAAATSREWFEHSARYRGQHPLQLAFNLMTRSKRITYENLAARDPALVAAVDAWYAGSAGAPVGARWRDDGATPLGPSDVVWRVRPDGTRIDGGPEARAQRGPSASEAAPPAPPPIFVPFRARSIQLANRVVVSPMCQYSAIDGCPTDWHLVHLGSRAVGGSGLVIAEMTDVTREGRISHGCAGMYLPEHRDAWRRIVEFVHGNTPARIGIQLAHAGRKGSSRRPWEGDDLALTAGEGAWETVAPSPLPYRPDWPAPRELSPLDLERLRGEFARAARWAAEAGFDWLELHMAHGYLLSSFLSPLANRRRDDFGGSLENRMRWPLEVFTAVREAWPTHLPISVRLNGTDWAEGGITLDETVAVSRALRERGCDLIDVSSGGNAPDAQVEYGRMYQVPFADRIRHEAGIPVMAVGALLGADHANTVLAAGRADLAVMARPHLADPYLTAHAGVRYAHPDYAWPDQYLRGRPREG
jgi:anthraniloyl-CoA monooxygenase